MSNIEKNTIMLHRLWNDKRALWNDKRAVTAIEYGLIASLIAVPIIWSLTLVGQRLYRVFKLIDFDLYVAMFRATF